MADTRIFGIWSRNYKLRLYFAEDIEEAFKASFKIRHTFQLRAVRRWRDLTEQYLAEYPEATKRALNANPSGLAEFDEEAGAWTVDGKPIE